MRRDLVCTVAARDLRGWRSLEPTWRALEREAAPAFYVTYDWLDAYWRTQGSAYDPYVLAVHDTAGRLVGLAPFETASSRLVARLRWRTTTLRFPCRREREGVEFLVRPMCEDAVAETIAAYLRTHRQGWQSLVLTDMQADGSIARAFRGAFERDPRHCLRLLPRPPTPMVRLSGTWPEYLAGLSRVTRKGILRSWRQLEARGGSFRQLERPDAVRAALGFLIDTKNARLRAVADGSVYERPDVRAFLELAVDGTARSGRLLCTLIEVDDGLAAVDLGFRIGDRAWTFLDAFDPRWHALGLGARLMEYAIREGLATGTKELWLGQGDSEFKARYASELRPNVDLVIERRWLTATKHAIGRLQRAGSARGRGSTGDTSPPGHPPPPSPLSRNAANRVTPSPANSALASSHPSPSCARRCASDP